MTADLPIIIFKDKAAWLTWLKKNHSSPTGIWAQLAKKGTGVTTATYEDLREGALIYGWIDGQGKGLDATYHLIRFTPRRPGSNWSRINRDIVDALMQQGKMQPAGIAQVEVAQKDGRWERAYEGQSKMTVPPDFADLLAKNPKAAAKFEVINKANRYSFLYRIHTAKTAETRAKHMQKAITMLESGQLYHP